MSNGNISERFSRLRRLREILCQKDVGNNWKEAFEARDWVVAELNELKSIASQSNADVEKIKEKIDTIISVFQPNCPEKENAK